ncbi:MAG: hypothetical protein GY810_01950 [Aureispira sp.]|nr:hypothetical protein [Aureispira sp.]
MNKLFLILITFCILTPTFAQDVDRTADSQKQGIPDLGEKLKIDNREVIFTPKIEYSQNWGFGLAWVRVQLNEEGLITKATFVYRSPKGMSNISPSPKQRLVAENCAKKYKFEPTKKKGEVTGYIPIRFSTH